MKKSKNDCDLKSCSFCKLCLKEWLPAIDTNRQTLQVKKGEEFIKEGETVTGVYFVYEGAVKVHKQWGEKELIVRFAKKGDIVGHRGLGNDTFYPVSATAIEPSTVCFIEINFFLTSFSKYFYPVVRTHVTKPLDKIIGCVCVFQHDADNSDEHGVVIRIFRVVLPPPMNGTRDLPGL